MHGSDLFQLGFLYYFRYMSDKLQCFFYDPAGTLDGPAYTNIYYLRQTVGRANMFVIHSGPFGVKSRLNFYYAGQSDVSMAGA